MNNRIPFSKMKERFPHPIFSRLPCFGNGEGLLLFYRTKWTLLCNFYLAKVILCINQCDETRQSIGKANAQRTIIQQHPSQLPPDPALSTRTRTRPRSCSRRRTSRPAPRRWRRRRTSRPATRCSRSCPPAAAAAAPRRSPRSPRSWRSCRE